MPLLFDSRTLTPRYPGIGRYGLGLLNALAETLQDDLTLLHHASQPPLAAQVKHFALSSDIRTLSDQVFTPITLTKHFDVSKFVYHSPFYIFPYRLPHPTVVTLYDLTPLRWPQGFTFLARQLYRLTHHLAAARAQHIITLSAAVRNDFIQHLHIPPSKITAIPPGPASPSIPLRSAPGTIAFHLPPVSSHASRLTPHASPSTFHLPPSYLLYVGINKPHKNLPRLIQAYASLDRATPPLLIVGPVDMRFPQAQAMTEQLGLTDRVRFLGHVPEETLDVLYANATVFIFPTLAEGFGFPVLEAMAHGTPVVCSDIPVLRELAGEAALYFDPLLSDAIASAITEALTDANLRTSLRERGLARAKEFSWTTAAHKTIEIYKQVSRA
jgi:glycosyltransferase involved in cell wall biosynthesis